MKIRPLINFLIYLTTTRVAILWVLLIVYFIILTIYPGAIQKMIYPERMNFLVMTYVVMGIFVPAIIITIVDHSVKKLKK